MVHAPEELCEDGTMPASRSRTPDHLGRRTSKYRFHIVSARRAFPSWSSNPQSRHTIERLRRGTLDLLSQGVVIPVEEADHEAGIVFLGEC